MYCLQSASSRLWVHCVHIQSLPLCWADFKIPSTSQGLLLVGQPLASSSRQLESSSLAHPLRMKGALGMKHSISSLKGSNSRLGDWEHRLRVYYDRRGCGRRPGYLFTRGGWLSHRAADRRVNEVDAALLHLEGRTHGRGGRWEFYFLFIYFKLF